MSTRIIARLAFAAALAVPGLAAAQVANVSVTAGTPVPMGANPSAVAYSYSTGKVYVANRDSDTVSAYVPFATQAKSIPVGHAPMHLAINNDTETVYVANADGTMTVIDARTDTVRTTQAVNVTGTMSVNTATNHMFMVRQSAVDEVNVIVGDNYLQTDATRSWAPIALATNQATNRLFVAHQSSGDIVPMDMNGDLVYPTRECPDGNGGLIPDTNPDPPACIRVPGYPVAVAVNPVTNRAYALSSTNEITVIQGPNMTFQTFTPPTTGNPRNPKTIAVDPVHNRIYAVYDQLVVVMDGNTNAMVTAFTPNGGQNTGIAVDYRFGTVLVSSDMGVLNYFVGDGQDGNRQVNVPPSSTGIVFDGASAAYLATPQGLTRLSISYGAGMSIQPSPLHLTVRQPGGPVPPDGALTIDTSSDIPGIDFKAVYYRIRRHTNQTGDGLHRAIRNADGSWSAPIVDKEPTYGYTITAFGVTGLETTSFNPEAASLPVSAPSADMQFTLQNITPRVTGVVKSFRRRDLNADGRNDLVWAHSSGQHGVWLMNGLDPSPAVLSAPAGATISGFGDFDGDGRTDAIWNATGTATMTVTLLDGAAVRASSSFSTPNGTSGQRVWATGDFDGDGKADLLWGFDWAVSFMNGTSIRATEFFYPPMGPDEQRGVPVAVGDFNGDGRDEVVWMGGDGYTTMCGLGAGGMPCATVRGPDTGFVPIAIGDFNGDGKDDIVWKGADGAITLWLMNGATPIDSTLLLAGGYGWTVFAAPDLDGDRKADLVWRHDSGAVGGWLMDGITPRGYRGWLGGGTCWAPVMASEFGGDGKAELLWRCSSGEYGAWTMNGLDIAQARSYGLAGSGWEAYP